MNTKLTQLLTCIVIIVMAQFNYAQVGIGTTNPEGALDITSANQGFVIPRLALVNVNTETAINPQGGSIPAGTIVYNIATSGTIPNNVGPGLYYWNGVKWVAFAGSPGGLDWSLDGNSGTSTSNYLGTTDAQNLRISTNGIQRMRIGATGRLGINTNDLSWAQTYILGNSGSLYATLGIDNTVSGKVGIYSRSVGQFGMGVRGQANHRVSWGVFGYNTNGVGTIGQSIGGANRTVGTVGSSEGNTYATLNLFNAGVAGTGEVGIFGMSTGGIGASRYGGFFMYDTDGNVSNLDSDSPIAYLAGVDGTYLGGDISFGGYFSGRQDNSSNVPDTNPNDTGGADTADFAYVGAQWGGTNYKILGNGVVSTIVDGEGDEKHIMFAAEAPEVLFEDYGIGQLKNGEAIIKIDPILQKNIVVNEKHPLKVFIQLEGNCNGVYVTQKSDKGFTVTELNYGKSNTSFSYHLVATRADRKSKNGVILSKNASLRFPIAPHAIAPLETVGVTVPEEPRMGDK